MRQFGLNRVFSRLWGKDQDGDYNLDGVSKCILVVDDSPTAILILKKILEESGYTILVARDALSAIDIAKKKTPDLILMDIVMPGMNGFEATRVLTKEPMTSDIPVVIVSGTNQPSDKVWGTKLGAKGFLTKPVNKKALLNIISLIFTTQNLNAAVAEVKHQNPPI
jgi:twitching motility two-component system response regulator PilH